MNDHEAAKEKAEIILHTRKQHRAYHEDPNLAACYLERCEQYDRLRGLATAVMKDGSRSTQEAHNHMKALRDELEKP